jgi:hypothetical protein
MNVSAAGVGKKVYLDKVILFVRARTEPPNKGGLLK